MDYDFEPEEIQEGEEDTRDEEYSEEILPNKIFCKRCTYYVCLPYCPVLSLGLKCERK